MGSNKQLQEQTFSTLSQVCLEHQNQEDQNFIEMLNTADQTPFSNSDAHKDLNMSVLV